MNEITTTEVDLLLHKLFVEQIPVTVYYQRNDVKVLQQGFLAGISESDDLIVSSRQTVEPLFVRPIEPHLYYVAVRIRYNASGVGWLFWYNDSVDERFGDTSLRFECPDGGRLILYFSL